MHKALMKAIRAEISKKSKTKNFVPKPQENDPKLNEGKKDSPQSDSNPKKVD